MVMHVLGTLDPCDPSPCRNGATCVDLGNTTYNCICAPGFTAQNCDVGKLNQLDIIEKNLSAFTGCKWLELIKIREFSVCV